MKYQLALTESKLRAAKPEDKPYKLADGGGLHVIIAPNGAIYWRYNYRVDKVFKTLAIGTYPTLSLKVARAEHQKAAAIVQLGGDPMAEKKAVKEEQKRQATFRDAAQEWLEVKVPATRRGIKTSTRDRRMVRYLNAAFGDKSLDDLRVRDLADLLSKYEAAGKYETRVRLQGTAVAIAGFAVGKGYLDRSPFSDVKFAAAFTSPGETRESRPAIVEAEPFGHLLRKIDHYEGRNDNIVGLGLRLLALVWTRPGELANAKWSHIDFAAAKFSVPFEELKQRTERKKSKKRIGESFEVPLSRQALALLRQLRSLTGGGTYLFPSRGEARTISESTLNNALKALGYEGLHCPHGFRSSASTLLNKERVTDRSGHKRRRFETDLIEVQLDHVDYSTQAIYDRDGLWDERVEMMQFWADKVDQLRSDAPAKKAHLTIAA